MTPAIVLAGALALAPGAGQTGEEAAPPPAATAPGSPAVALPEQVVKAGFLYNFAKYVDWPDEAFAAATEPIVIGVVGADPFGTELESTLAGKTVKGRGFTIRRFARPRDVERTHILFVPRSERDHVTDVLAQVRGWPVLVVGDSEGFSRAGGMINIAIENEQPRLEVNPDAAAAAGLVIDARLLRLAAIVRPEKAP